MFSSNRDYLKTIFQEEKNTKMNAIKKATQPKIQPIFQALKNISQQKKIKHLDPKHTHTHTKSNQFYISKTS